MINAQVFTSIMERNVGLNLDHGMTCIVPRWHTGTRMEALTWVVKAGMSFGKPDILKSIAGLLEVELSGFGLQ